jgi:hypothetical protein
MHTSLIEIIISLFITLCIVTTATAAAPRQNIPKREIAKVRAALERVQIATLRYGIDARFTIRQASYTVTYLWTKRSKRPERLRDTTKQLPSSLSFKMNSLPDTVMVYQTGVLSPRTITIEDATRRCTLTVSLRGRLTEGCL